MENVPRDDQDDDRERIQRELDLALAATLRAQAENTNGLTITEKLLLTCMARLLETLRERR